MVESRETLWIALYLSLFRETFVTKYKNIYCLLLVFICIKKNDKWMWCLWVRDCCECFVFKYTHALTVQWTRNFQYCTKRSWVQYWKFRVHCTVSKCVYLKTKHELTVSNPFNIQFEFTAGDRLAVASRATCLNEKTMSQEKQMKTRTFNVQEYLI